MYTHSRNALDFALQHNDIIINVRTQCIGYSWWSSYQQIQHRKSTEHRSAQGDATRRRFAVFDTRASADSTCHPPSLIHISDEYFYNRRASSRSRPWLEMARRRSGFRQCHAARVLAKVLLFFSPFLYTMVGSHRRQSPVTDQGCFVGELP